MAVADQRVNNLQKAAILLASLPQDEAVKLLERLDDEQAKSVAIEMANLGRISADVQKSVFTEFENADPNAFGGERGGRDKAMDLLTKAKSGSKRVIDDVRQSIEAMPFGFLQKVDPQNLLTFIIDEHPQTIALILSHLPPQARRRDHRRPADRAAARGHPPHRQHGANEPRRSSRSRSGAREADGERDEPVVRTSRRRAERRRDSQRHRSRHRARRCSRTSRRKTPTWSKKSAA